MSAAVSVKPSSNPSQSVLRFRHAFKVALAMALYYWLALSLNLEQLKYGALAIALIGLDTTGASLQKGLLRIAGTTVGLAVGLIGLALFAQALWPTLIFHVAWLLVVGYSIQSGTHRYAWYVAGFLPVLIWSTTYGKVDTAFDYAVFRYTETTIGIVVFTLVSVLVWPQNAGDQLKRQSMSASSALRQLFDIYRRQLREGELQGEADPIESQLADGVSGVLLTLQTAALDTLSVRASKAQWKAFHANLHASSEAIELWRHCIADCSDLDMERLLLQSRSSVDALAQRLARIENICSLSNELKDQNGDEDDSLLKPMPLGLNRDSAAELSLQQRASLLNFVQQWNMLDQSSLHLLHSVRELRGLAPLRPADSEAPFADDNIRLRWDPIRVVNGMFPALCFVAAFFFWIFVQPPTGPSVPNMAVTYALMVLLTPMRIFNLIPSVIIVMAVLLAPTYLLVMPHLNGGPELLTLVFIYCLGCGLFHGRLAGIKSMGLPLFVMMTGISNQQSYSFMGFVDGAQMQIMALGIVAVVQVLLHPSRPEKDAVDSVRWFFRSCANVFKAHATDDLPSQARAHRLGNRIFESYVAPSPAKIRTIEKGIDYSQLPDDAPQKVQDLMEGIESITRRMQSLDIAHQRLARFGTAVPESFHRLSLSAHDTLRRMFESLPEHDPTNSFEKQRRKLLKLSVDFHQWFDDLEMADNKATIQDEVIVDLYALMGSFRGLVDAIYKTRDAIGQLEWQEWEIAKF